MRIPSVHTWRRISQFAVLAFLIAAAAVPLVRMDLVRGRVILWGHTWPLAAVNPAGMPLSLVLAVCLAASLFGLLLGFSFLLERSFCGWACPQGTLSELADRGTVLLAGRRELVGARERLPGRIPQARPARRALVLLATLAALAAGSLGASFVTLSFLADPAFLVRQLITGRPWGLALGGLALLWAGNLTFLRHRWCRWCPLGVSYQMVFAWLTRLLAYTFPALGDTLRVRFLAPKDPACGTCRFCERSCFMQVPILSRDTSWDCVSCGECVAACDRARRLRGVSLRGWAPPPGSAGRGTIRGRALLAAGVAAVSLLLSAAPLLAVPGGPFLQLRSERGQLTAGGAYFTYSVAVVNDSLRNRDLSLSATGLPPGVPSPAIRRLRLPRGATRVVQLRIDAPGDPRPYLGRPGIPFRFRLTNGSRRIGAVRAYLHLGGSLG